MIIFIQFPIVDTRSFRTSDTGRLAAPVWPAPIPYREFVRNFGQIQSRGKGGIRGWVAESELCRGKHAIRFVSGLQLGQKRARGYESRMTLRCGGRHFYFDGQAVAKFEVVLVVPRRSVFDFRGPVNELLDRVLDIRIAVPRLKTNPEKDDLCLRNAGKFLAWLYLVSSTRKSRVDSADPRWIKPGEPLIVLERDDAEDIEIPRRHSDIALTDSGMDLQHWRLPGANPLGVWSIRTRWSQQDSRTLRMLLMRLHAEQQSLQHVLKSISSGEICPAPDTGDDLPSSRLQFYLNVATRRIFKLSGSAEKLIEPEQVAQVVRDSFELVSPGQRDALLQTLQLYNIRPQVKDKLESTIEQYGNVYELAKLSQELASLRAELQRYDIVESRQQAQMLLEAEKSARAGDEGKTIEHLKSVGKWVLIFAEKVGVDLATAALKSAFGM